jgi:hypothetical protein
VKNYRAAALGVGFVASLAFVAGCQGTTSPSPGSSAASPTPTRPAIDELTAAATKLSASTYKYSVKSGGTALNGSADPAGRSAKIVLSQVDGQTRATADIVLIGTDYYARLTGLALPGLNTTKWYHLDGTKVKSLTAFGIGELTDPAGALQLVKQATTVEKVGDRSFKGTLDLNKAAAGIRDMDVKQLGDKAKNIPFEATVDGEGRLATMTFTVPASGSSQAIPVDIAFSDPGAKVDISKPPAADVTEAPGFVYSFFNS